METETRVVEIPAKVTPIAPDGTGALIAWLGLREGQWGTWERYPEFPRKTVMITGGRIALEGTNDPKREEDIHVLHDDAQGWEIGDVGCYLVRENPLWLRPRVQTGDSINVRVCATK